MESVFSLRVGPKDGAQILRFRYRPLGYPAGFSIFFLFKGLFIYLSAQARMFLLVCKVTFLIVCPLMVLKCVLSALEQI